MDAFLHSVSFCLFQLLQCDEWFQYSCAMKAQYRYVAATIVLVLMISIVQLHEVILHKFHWKNTPNGRVGLKVNHASGQEHDLRGNSKNATSHWVGEEKVEDFDLRFNGIRSSSQLFDKTGKYEEKVPVKDLDLRWNSQKAQHKRVNTTFAVHLIAPNYKSMTAAPSLTYIKYDSFEMKLPRFLVDEDKRIFLAERKNTRILTETGSTIGVIRIVRNGYFELPYECGYHQVNYDQVRVGIKGAHHYRALLPLIVPEGWSFQHFMDGTLPKLIQARRLLAIPDVMVLIERIRDVILWDVLKTLGVPRKRVLLYERGGYSADYLILGCVTPPLHPRIWHAARLGLGAPEHLEVPQERAHIVLLTRKLTHNGGRRIINIEEVKGYLSERYGERFTVYNGDAWTVSRTVEIFRNAKVVIGVHGGAFYNMYFAPKETVLIEFMPMSKNNSYELHLGHTIFWTMANMLSQTYWRLYFTQTTRKSDGIINVSKLGTVLDKIELNKA